MQGTVHAVCIYMVKFQALVVVEMYKALITCILGMLMMYKRSWVSEHDNTSEGVWYNYTEKVVQYTSVITNIPVKRTPKT